jgi:RNA polymerase sigma factor (TIGR02999 family)
MHSGRQSTAPEARPLPQLTPRLYADLRRMAHSVMRAERAGHTLQPTAVLNEAFSRLMRSQLITRDAPHFFRLAAQSMRHVLIDHARQRNRDKRDASSAGELYANTDSDWQGGVASLPLDVLDIDRALTALAERSPRAAHLLELRYFAGLDDTEIGVLCGISKTTVERECRLGKAFLNRFTQEGRSGG